MRRPCAERDVQPGERQNTEHRAGHFKEELFESTPEAAKTVLGWCFGGAYGRSHEIILAQNSRRDAAGTGPVPERKGCEHFGDNDPKLSCIQLSVSLKWP